MKLLAITNIYPTSERPWLGTFVEQQVKGLQSIGVEVKVLYFDRKKEGPLIYYRMGSRIAATIAEFRPDLIHVMYGGVMADKITAQSWGVPVVLTFHGSDLLGENLSGFFRKIVSHYGVHCSRRAARRASGVVVVAPHLLKALPAAFHLPSPISHLPPSNSHLPSPISPLPPQVRVIPCGIDLDRFKPMEQEASRQKLGWAPGTFHILFPANTGDPVKRPWLARAAVQALKEQGVKAELHLLSGVAYADVPLWINASDVLILTSLHEGSPMVVKEALACGVPVVSVDVGDVAERISGIEGCHLAKPEPGDLALKLLEVWRRKQRVDSTTAIQALSIGYIAERLKGFYDEVLQEQVACRGVEMAGMTRR
jgi:glycosyltransferase involved in cell wall biosynthesis